MAADIDLLIRGGSVVDGTGAPARTADIAISDGHIVAIGKVEAAATRVIDADGAMVTPGFVDVHTHYDGQATWDERLQPSAQHGVTTVVMSNCGVGFAPVRRDHHEQLIELMEGVEDIPGAALHEGLAWDWESFPEYLDALERRPHDIDFGTQVPHGALRLFVMGERGANRLPATAEEIAEMGRLAAEAIEAGALGFTTSRTLNHRTSRGEPTPTLTASRDELVGIAAAIGRTGAGVLQVISDFPDFDDEWTTLRAMMRTSDRPLSVSLSQVAHSPTAYRTLLDLVSAANDEGLTMRAQVGSRAIGVLVGLTSSVNPVQPCPSYQAISHLPLDARVQRMAEPRTRSAILAELIGDPRSLATRLHRLYVLGDPPNYEPGPEDSVGSAAARAGRADAPHETLYDLLLAGGGTNLLYLPIFNYVDGNLDAVAEMLAHPHTIPGLGDGGAHVGAICDGSFPTTLIAHWGRDRTRGPRFEVPWLVRRQTHDTAEALGLHDRGVLAAGFKADLNVIDMDHLGLGLPRMVYDLPAGGKRLVQGATGYLHTIVAGTEIYRDGAATGQLPGRLVRGPQQPKEQA